MFIRNEILNANADLMKITDAIDLPRSLD